MKKSGLLFALLLSGLLVLGVAGCNDAPEEPVESSDETAPPPPEVPEPVPPEDPTAPEPDVSEPAVPDPAPASEVPEDPEDSQIYTQGDFPDEILLKAPPEYGEMREAPVLFSHSQHAAFHCGDCHHDGQGRPWDGTYEITGCMSSGCHDMAVAETPEDRRDIRYFYKAYHDMCMTGCHRDLARAGEPSGPVACPDCHHRDQ
ncbi:cytochrome c3 family protein [Desulfonatronospira sp.]|uniref:cytochrome c3 family protein n=1 Tax=Desulfonatronospira sp. TaxID=1962951 RepID=UPI0025BDDC4C|nr:cytochrome c3 family protein [Desulfonatronospira sp.]